MFALREGMVSRDTIKGAEAQASGKWACVHARADGGRTGRTRRSFLPGFSCVAGHVRHAGLSCAAQTQSLGPEGVNLNEGA